MSHIVQGIDYKPESSSQLWETHNLLCMITPTQSIGQISADLKDPIKGHTLTKLTHAINKDFHSSKSVNFKTNIQWMGSLSVTVMSYLPRLRFISCMFDILDDYQLSYCQCWLCGHFRTLPFDTGSLQDHVY